MAKINIGGKEVEGEFIDFQSVIEEWQEYRVGEYVIKTKLVVSDIFRVKDQFDQMGNPVFLLQWSNPVTVRKVDG